MTVQQIKILTISIVISACGQSSVDSKKENVKDSKQIDSVVVSQGNSQTIDNLNIARQFSENFTPDTTTENGFDKMFTFPDSVVTAFKSLRLDRPNQEKYLTLLYLKIYRGHLQCCHQSYELRKNPSKGIDSITDPLLYEYNLIIKLFDSNKSIEMVGSGIAHNWVEKNKGLLSYDKIKREYKIIKTIQTNIEKGVYWKD